MPVAYQSQAHGTYTVSTATSCVVPKPSGTALDDILIVWLYTGGNVQTITGPAGWATERQAGGTNFTATMLWKRATSTEVAATNFTFTYTTSGWSAGTSYRYSGAVTTGNPFSGTAGTYTAASGTIPSVSYTTTGAGAGLWLFMADQDGATVTQPSGYTLNGTVQADSAQTVASRADTAGSKTTGTGTTSATGAPAVTFATTLLEAAATTQTLTFPTVDATGWTVTGGTAQAVLADTDDTTHITSAVSPSGQTTDLTLPAIETPTGNLVATVRAARLDSTSASIVGTLRDGTTTVATATTVNPTGTVGDLSVTFAAADISSVTQAKWNAGTLVLRLAVTAT